MPRRPVQVCSTLAALGPGCSLDVATLLHLSHQLLLDAGAARLALGEGNRDGERRHLQAMYIQVVGPGIVKLPREFELEVIGRYDNLTVVMPPPEIIAAAKLVRGSEVDFQDVAWWVGQRGLDASDIEAAIDLFPNSRDREAARENIVVVSLVADGHGR